MAIYTVLLSMVVCVAGYNQDNVFTTSPQIAEVLQTLCPGINDCSRNQTSEEFSSFFSKDSCCAGCSCRPSCKVNGNCCFQNRTQKFEEQSLRTRHSCLFPSSVQPSVEQRFRFHSYTMISEVLRTSDDVSSSTVCGDRNIAPWGSLYPVYSAKRKQIYKNSVCAEADGVDDGKVWDAELVCQKSPYALASDVSLFVQELDSNSSSNLCRVDFIYKDNVEDIQMQKCYLDLVDTCHASDFQIPDEVSISKTEIIAACTSGLLSLYGGTTMYSNVFCRICNDDSFQISDKCYSSIDVSGNGLDNQGFVALLDGDFMKTIQKNNKRMANFPEACCMQDTTCLNKIGCRKLFCPSGQMHDESGQCGHPSKIWYKKLYEINIELTAEEKLDVNEVFQITGPVTTTLPDLQTPWRHNWTILSVYHEDISQNENNTRFLVTIINTLSKIYPEQFLNYVQNTVNQDWLLKHSNETIPLKSSFSRYVTLNRNSVINFGNDSKTISTPLFRNVYSTRVDISASKQLVTKLYLCDQVELTENDFILSRNRRMLFNKITSALMFDGEFALIYGQNFDGLRARICLNDSGFYRTNEDKTNEATVPFESLTCKLCCTFLLFVLLYVGEG